MNEEGKIHNGDVQFNSIYPNAQVLATATSPLSSIAHGQKLDASGSTGGSTGAGTSPPPGFSVELAEEIRNHMIGPQVWGWRRPFFFGDPFLAEQYVRDSRGFNDINLFFGIMFRLAVFAYIIYILIEYSQAKPSTAFSLTPTMNMAPIQITLSLDCNSKWGCYNWTTAAAHTWANPATYNMWSPVVVTGYYNYVNKAYCPEQNFNTTVRSAFAQANVTFTLCYSPSFSDGVVLSIPFNAQYSSSVALNVNVLAPSYSNGMNFDLAITPSQQKVMYLSVQQVLTQGSKASPTYEPSVADLFYNGHTANTASTLTFKLQQFGFSREEIPPSSLLAYLGLIGGFNHFLFPFMNYGKSIAGIIWKTFIYVQDIPIKQWYGLFFNSARSAMTKMWSPQD